jgi:hypothetical protein
MEVRGGNWKLSRKYTCTFGLRENAPEMICSANHSDERGFLGMKYTYPVRADNGFSESSAQLPASD